MEEKKVFLKEFWKIFPIKCKHTHTPLILTLANVRVFQTVALK